MERAFFGRTSSGFATVRVDRAAGRPAAGMLLDEVVEVVGEV